MSNAVSIARQRACVPGSPVNSITLYNDTERGAGLTIEISILIDRDDVEKDLLAVAVGVVVTRSGVRSC
ncbi:hypothetical protein AB7008_15115 [Bradyrhizobium sp. 521_C7_N1_3]|uniref:hypothetical protein n=1 Tax=Bradyrhizobium sp. 521_C7_N1_3 TaxID=3240368 RepID=UPI003F8A98AA